MKEFWNDRYQNPEFAYGTDPNEFFRGEISKLKPGRILFPAEGEGRNAVYAAKLGWDVIAFDLSEAGKAKAIELSQKAGVSIDYRVVSLEEFDEDLDSCDALVLIFAHFPMPKRKAYHQKLLQFLKPGGFVILEGFSKKHLEYNRVNAKAGGPQDLNMLFGKEELEEDFENLEILKLNETEKVLSEGLYHQGQSAVIQLLARKK